MTNVKTNSIKAWLLAARPKTLTGAAIPVMLGCALAFIYGHFQLTPALLCFLFAFLMQIDANFINDLFDFLKGSDREDRLGPERACAQGWISAKAMKAGIACTTLLAGITGLCLLCYGGLEMIPVGIACMIFAFLYTAGPYPLAYHGWGDLLVLVFFGFVPVGCTYYVMAHDWNMSVTMASLACGLIIDTLLMINNFRDRTGCYQWQENHCGTPGSQSRTDSLLSVRTGGLLVLLLLPGNRENLCRTATPAIPDSTHSDHPAHGPYLPRESPERNLGRNLPQHAYFWIITHPRLNTLI